MDTFKAVIRDPVGVIGIVDELKRSGARVQEWKKKTSSYGSDWRCFDKGGNKIWIQHKYPGTGAARLQVTGHLSGYESISEFLGVMDGLLGNQLVYLLSAPLYRLDCCIDLGLEFLSFAKLVNVKNSRFMQEYRSKKNTIYFGCRPKQTCIYQKRLSKFDYPADSMSDPRIGSRIEVRLTSRKVPIKSLNELSSLMTFDPFKHIEIRERNFDLMHLPEKGARRWKIIGFDAEVDRIGYSATKTSYNRTCSPSASKHLDKYYSPRKGLNLLEIWKLKVERFLEGRSK